MAAVVENFRRFVLRAFAPRAIRPIVRRHGFQPTHNSRGVSAPGFRMDNEIFLVYHAKRSRIDLGGFLGRALHGEPDWSFRNQLPHRSFERGVLAMPRHVRNVHRACRRVHRLLVDSRSQRGNSSARARGLTLYRDTRGIRFWVITRVHPNI